MPNLGKDFGYTIRKELYYDTALSALYIESTRDEITDVTSQKFWQVVGHEVGHKTLDQSGETLDPGLEHLEGGLMSGPPQTNILQDIPGMRRLTAATVRRFREARRW